MSTATTGPTTVEEIVRALQELNGEAFAKEIQDRVTDNRGGKPPQYKSDRSYHQTIQKIIEDYCPQSDNYLESRAKLFKRVSRGRYKLIALVRPPEEIPVGSSYTEGSVERILVNRYERDLRARMDCIKAHGTTCCICGFSFGAVYGPEAKDYIHVHHTRPLSEVGDDYVVDPVKDLRPVCPNCHAVLHLGGRCREIEDVKKLLAAHNQS